MRGAAVTWRPGWRSSWRHGSPGRQPTMRCRSTAVTVSRWNFRCRGSCATPVSCRFSRGARKSRLRSSPGDCRTYKARTAATKVGHAACIARKLITDRTAIRHDEFWSEEACMLKLKIRQGDWIVACDGKKALLMENAGDEK